MKSASAPPRVDFPPPGSDPIATRLDRFRFVPPSGSNTNTSWLPAMFPISRPVGSPALDVAFGTPDAKKYPGICVT